MKNTGWLVILAAVACGSSCKRVSCGEGPACAEDHICLEGQCIQPCVDDDSCQGEKEACREGYCRPKIFSPPVGSASASLVTDEDTPATVVLTGTDAHDPVNGLRVTVISGPAHGTLNTSTGSAPLELVYTPAADYFGVDALLFTVTDSDNETSAAVAIAIEVRPVNDPPVAIDTEVELNAAGTVTGTLLANDVEGDPLTFELVQTMAGGSVTVAPETGSFTYERDAGFNCYGGFTFVAHDGNASSRLAMVTVDRGQPVAKSLSPQRGTTGVPLVLEGTGFCDNPGEVTIGGRAAKVLSWSDDSISVEVPVGIYTGGRYDVVATTVRGFANAALEYEVVPWIATASPRVVNKGEVLEIRGDAFGLGTGKVYVGGVLAPVREWKNTSIQVTVPASAGAGRQMLRLDTVSNETSNSYPVTVRGRDLWIADPVPGARHAHTAVWTGSEMIVWGGYGGDNTGGRYNPKTTTWIDTNTTGAPTGRQKHTTVWTGREMMIWGGIAGDIDLNSGGRYHYATDIWTTISGTGAPVARSGHTAVWTGSEMIIWGGSSGSNYFNSGSRYNPTTNMWTAISPNAPSARSGHTAIWTGSEMIVWGGSAGNSYFGTGSRYNPSTNTWTAISTTNAPSARSGHTAIWTGSEMMIWGGSAGGGGLNTGARYNPTTNTWTAISTTDAPSARSGHTVIWTGRTMIVWGGSNGYGAYFSTGAQYHPANDTWTAISTTNAPSARSDHTAIWTGSEMIAWGGRGNVYSNTGGQYNPVTDTWNPTTTTNALSPRLNPTFIWTGNEMIVGGGFDNDCLGDGGRYNPVADTWIPMNTDGAPFACLGGNTIIWTGNEVIIWGGYYGSTNPDDPIYPINSGHRYNPQTDTWIETSLANAPTNRHSHTAIWTGSEMIVWGGHEIGGYLNTGGRYNPITDTWISITTTNAPSARSGHTAVWTGSEMVIWGGGSYPGARYNPQNDTWTTIGTTNLPADCYGRTAIWTENEVIIWSGSNSTGCRYNPATSTWTSITIINAPPPRYSYTSVWTGLEMIVWGGSIFLGGDGQLNTGGRYNSTADSWTPTSINNAPTRRSHIAVWTGSEMIVWGGHGATPLSTGSRYIP